MTRIPERSGCMRSQHRIVRFGSQSGVVLREGRGWQSPFAGACRRLLRLDAGEPRCFVRNVSKKVRRSAGKRSSGFDESARVTQPPGFTRT
jgi:hypothetical protein